LLDLSYLKNLSSSITRALAKGEEEDLSSSPIRALAKSKELKFFLARSNELVDEEENLFSSP